MMANKSRGPHEIRRRHKAKGEISSLGWLALGSLLAIVGLAFLLLRLGGMAGDHPHDRDTVRIYCASGVSRPIEESLVQCRQLLDHDVQLVRIGGSGRLFGQIQAEYETGVLRGADLFVSADRDLLLKGQGQGIVDELFPLAEQHAVIATWAGSGVKATSLRSLVESETVRFGIANENAAIGKLTRDVAKHEGILQDVLYRRKMESENVMQLIQALHSKTLDAVVVWDAAVKQMNRELGGEALLIVAELTVPPRLQSNHIAMGVINRPENEITHDSSRREMSTAVAEFLSSPTGGLSFLAAAGFETTADRRPLPGDEQ